MNLHTVTHLLFIIFLVNANDRGVTNPLGSSLTKFGSLLGFKSYCIPFLNIPLSYISELFMGGVWVWTPFLPHFGKKILTLFEDITFP